MCTRTHTPTTLKFCSGLAIVSFHLELNSSDNVFLNHTRPQTTRGSANICMIEVLYMLITRLYQTVKHWQCMCLNAHTLIISMHKPLLCVLSAGMCVLFLTVSVWSRFHAYYGLSGYELYSLCLMCCIAAKWDYGREQKKKRMRCFSCPCQGRIA